MPRCFNLELLNTHLEKDSAKLLGEYDKLTQTSKITFLCSCKTEITKQFLSGVNYGFRCSDCQKVEQKAKREENRGSKSTTYTLDLLNECIKRDNATLEGEIPPLYKEALINFRCHCGTTHVKSFVYIKKVGMFCKSCSTKQRVEKASKTNLERYGSTCTLQSESIKAKAEETLLERFGTTNILTLESVKEKIARTNLIKYGAENPYASKEIIEKIRKTCKGKYGTEFPTQTKLVQEKRKQTNLEKYGVEVSSQADCVKQKARETNLLIYGSEHHIIPEIMEKAKQTNVERYGVEYTFQAESVKEKIKETMLERYGVDHSMKSELIKEKSRNTNFKKLGVPYPMMSKTVRDKYICTSLAKYGFKSPKQSEIVKRNTTHTCLEKYGFEHAFQAPCVKEKIKKTMVARYGVEYPSQDPSIKQKVKNTVIIRYGADHPFKNETVRMKKDATNLLRYGTCYPTQSLLIQSKIQKSGFNYRNYKCPSGAIRKIQGFEHYALDVLFKSMGYKESEVHTDRSIVPRIEYKMNDKTHYYFPDIWIPSQNKLIEVKSKWTYELHKERNMKKQEACKSAGYNFEFWVFDSRGQQIKLDCL